MMSIAPKIDENAFFLGSKMIDIAFFTETWLKNSIPDEAINIAGYNLLRRDRLVRAHGGVCMKIRNSIACRPLPEFQSDDHEVLWSSIRPRRLPRGFSSIVLGAVYHPPDADCQSMRDYIRDALVKIESTYPNSAVIIAGDFNKLDLKAAVRPFQLKPAINFPTRGENTLDKIFTTLIEYYLPPVGLPPFGLSDHLTITMSPGLRRKQSKPKSKVIKVRDKRPSYKASVGRFLLKVPWAELSTDQQSCDEKLGIFNDIINFGLNTIMPEQSIRVHPSDRPWLTVS